MKFVKPVFHSREVAKTGGVGDYQRPKLKPGVRTWTPLP